MNSHCARIVIAIVSEDSAIMPLSIMKTVQSFCIFNAMLCMLGLKYNLVETNQTLSELEYKVKIDEIKICII